MPTSGINKCKILTAYILWILLGTKTSADDTSVLTVTSNLCITNSSYALSINGDLNYPISTTTSKFYPPPPSYMKNMTCKIRAYEACSSLWDIDLWSIERSITGRINQIITDWRWEEFATYKTVGADGSGKLNIGNYNILNNISRDTFMIPISIRSKKAAHIFLCEGEIYRSACYWIVLQDLGNAQSKSFVRKCEANTISDFLGKSRCNRNLMEKVHETSTHILSENYWSHFLITKRDNILQVTRNNQELFQLQIRNDIIVNKMFVHSGKFDALWKIHDYYYIYSTERGYLQLGPSFQIKKGQNCISMFIVMCTNCRLNVSLGTNTYNFTTKDEKWKEIKIIYFSEETTEHNKLFFLVASDQSEGLFWGINYIRQCTENEFRYIPNYFSQCQLVNNENFLNSQENYNMAILDSNCAENTFGKYCIPCEIINPRQSVCIPLKYCELYNEKQLCYCTAGYQWAPNNENYCNQACPTGRYGHGCKKECSNCLHQTCSATDGVCHKECLNDFKGTKCDIPPATILKHPPDILKVGPTWCTVQVTNFNVKGSKEPQSYNIQFGKSPESSTEKITWENYPNSHKFNDNSSSTIDNLEPDTYYYVRAALYSGEIIFYQGEAIPKKRFRTSCKDITSEGIIISPKNTSAIINIQMSHHESCKIMNYNYTINNESLKTASKILKLSNLKPYTQYVFKLVHRDTQAEVHQSFHTLEGVPSKVTNLRSISTSATTINLCWEEPSPKNGLNLNYIIKYRHLRIKDCDETFNDYYKEHSTKDTEFVLRDLRAYSIYEINVRAVTTAGEGNATDTKIATNELGHLSENEDLKIADKNIYKDYIKVRLDINCTIIQGPIYVQLELSCENEWCSNPILISTRKYKSKLEIPVYGLFAYVKYSLIVKYARDTHLINFRVTNDTFTTLASVPKTIQEAGITSKDEKSISLRWKLSYPPTGILARYEIRYSTSGFFGTSKYKSPLDINTTGLHCKIWSDYYCAKISKGIQKNYHYNIEIWAANKFPKDLIRIYKFWQAIEPSLWVPDAPVDPNGTWTENDDLLISWKHPNATNGLVTRFDISVSDKIKTRDKTIFRKTINSEDNYNLTYTHLVNHTSLTACKEYTVSVQTWNKLYGSNQNPTFNIRNGPPSIKPTDSFSFTNSTNHTITINIPNFNDGSINYSQTLYLLISNSSNIKGRDTDLDNFEKHLQLRQPIQDLYHFRLIRILKVTPKILPSTFTIGSNDTSTFNNEIYSNPPLELGKSYNISVFFINECNSKIKLIKRHIIAYTTGDPKVYNNIEPSYVDDSSSSFYALILLLLIPVLAYVYIYHKKSNLQDRITTLFKPTSRSTLNRNIEERSLTYEPPNIPLTEEQFMPHSIKPIVRKKKPVLVTRHSRRVHINDFELYVKESIENGELERQHKLFPRGQTKPWDYGILKENKTKNRYNNLIAYDHTRVKLRKIEGIEFSDYINANYIDGYNLSKSYIATQGPKKATINDFWRMIWEEKVKHIIMLAKVYENGKKKVEKYWPDINEENDFNGIRVQYVSTKVYANHELRVFNVYNNTQHRKVEQLHFTSWPDHGVPLYSQSLVPFLKKILQIPNNGQSPVVVHCSAGVGRTGTIILCDICLRMAAAEGFIDFLAQLEHLRGQRANMVDNVEQYKLAHLVVLECLFGMTTSVICNDDMEKNINKLLCNNGAALQMRYLKDTEWQDTAMDTVWDDEVMVDVPLYPEKNRFQDIVPAQQHRIFLTRYPSDDETSSYINAILVDGFRIPGRFIVTQQPLPNTLGDFWRLAYERKCTVIISLNEINRKDKKSCQFWPENGSKINPVDYLKISHVNTVELDAYQITTVHMLNQKENENVSVEIISMNHWKPNHPLPKTVEQFLLFWEESDVLSRKSKSVIVTCYDGATASGLYIATSFVIEQMKLEQECDVCLAVRNIRHNRRQFVASQEQFEFLYKAALVYIDGFQSYSNFA